MTKARGIVQGSHDERHIVFYGLSTCIWCKRTRRFLEEKGVAFGYVYVDLLRGQEREEAVERVRRLSCFKHKPTTLIEAKDCRF